MFKVNWNDLQIALTVARAGSIKRAAANLKTTESTISRHITSVEKSLGYSLFERSPTGMFLTPAGEKLVQHLSRAEAQVETGIKKATHQQNSAVGKIRITAVPILMNHVIIPAARDFLSRYPDIELELLGLPADLSIMRREADIAVRLAQPSLELEAVTRRLTCLEYAVYANEAFCSDADEIELLPWITYEKDMVDLPQAKWIKERARKKGDPISALRCNDADGLIGAILSGLGKTILPRISADKIPSLTELSGFDKIPARELWLLIHPNVATDKRTRVAIDWLNEIFSAA